MGKPGKSTYVQQFADAYGLNGAVHADGSLEAAEPATLASFVAFSKGPRGKRVYLRGQDCWNGRLAPSLFRQVASADDFKLRWDAYRAFLDGLKEIFTGTRFRQRNFGAVVQHYGFRTPWLDVLDDIHAAAWFALHSRCNRNGTVFYQRSSARFGCVVVLAVPKDLRVQDLRAKHSSRNTRCHVQQAFSLAMQNDDSVELNPHQDFSPYVVGVVRIPASERWRLEGFRNTQSYFFPGADIDSTYKRLLAPKVADLVAKIEADFRVQGVLGSAAKYLDEMGKVD